MAIARPSARPAHPRPVTAALALLGLLVALAIAGPLLPGSEGVVGFGITLALLTALAMAGLWTRRRWGFAAALAVAALNLLLALPVFASDLPALLKVTSALVVLAAAAVIALLARPATRRRA